MRILLILFLISAFIASTASAALLTTALPIGQSKISLQASAVRDLNITGNSALSLTSLGISLTYGVTEKLDATLQYGTANTDGIKITGDGYGGGLKYTLLEEGSQMPVTMAVAALYKAATQVTALGKGSVTQSAFGAGISKVMLPFIPYLACGYRVNYSGATESSSQIDITSGTAIAWSQQGAVFIEVTNQIVDSKTALMADHSSLQFATSIGYTL